jgi:hypothetical protein
VKAKRKNWNNPETKVEPVFNTATRLIEDQPEEFKLPSTEE